MCTLQNTDTDDSAAYGHDNHDAVPCRNRRGDGRTSKMPSRVSHELCPVGLSCFCMRSPRPACHVFFDSLTADLSVVLPFFLDLTYTRQKNVIFHP